MVEGGRGSRIVMAVILPCTAAYPDLETKQSKERSVQAGNKNACIWPQAIVSLECGTLRRMVNQARWGAYCGTAVRHILQHNGHCADAAVISDFYTAQDLRIAADFDVVTQDRHGAVDLAIADCHSVAKRTIRADLHVRMNEDIAEMPNSQARTNGGSFWKTDTGDGLHQAKRQPIQRR